MAAAAPYLAVCPVLIGHRAELHTLHQLIDQVPSGRRQCVLIAGEAGVGKSRLTSEAKAYAADHGFVILHGACFPQDSTCPYAPLIDLLRAHLAAGALPLAALNRDEVGAMLRAIFALPRPVRPDTLDVVYRLTEGNPFFVSADGDTAVVGLWLTQGADNPAFAPIFSHLPTTQGDPAPVPGATVDAAQLLPADRAYYRYNGSLTTPPCTQGVKWVVIDDPVALSAEQISAFTAIYSGNFRPVQPLNSRTTWPCSPGPWLWPRSPWPRRP